VTVTDAFEAFKGELELPDRKQKLAASAQQEIRSNIAKQLLVTDSMLTGSYSRYTKIEPLNDIDILLVRNNRRSPLSTDGSGIFAGQALDQVVGAVQAAYGQKATTKKQSRSVNVQLSGLEFGFDIVPAWLREPDGFWIPDADSAGWIPTDPAAHAKILTEANELCDRKLKPVIKMLKRWSRNNLDLIRSFHLELICASVLPREEFKDFQTGVATVLVRLPVYVGKVFMDPIYGSSRVDKPLSAGQQTELIARAGYDAENAIEALRLENRGHHSEAIEKWEHIFIHGFPK